MHDLINSIANVIKSGAETVEKLGSATNDIITSSLRGRYVQRDGETDEAYKARLEFLKDKEIRRQENRLRYQALKAKERLERKELKHLRRKEQEETKIRKELERKQ